MTDYNTLTSDVTGPTEPRQRLPTIVWWLVAARTVNRMGAFSLPFLAVLLTLELGWSTAAVGVTMTAFGLATIPSRLVGGHLADRLGRRTTIVLGLTGCAIAQLGLAASVSATGAVGAVGTVSTVATVVALGLCFEIYEPPSQALIADHVPLENQPAAHGALATGLAIAGVAAGALATVLTRIDLHWLFVADAVSCLGCAALLACRLPSRRDQRTAPDSLTPDPRLAAPDGRSPWRDRRLRRLVAVQTGFAVVYLQTTVALPLSLLERGLPSTALAVLLMVSATTFVAGQPLLRMGRLRRLHRQAALRTGYLLLAAGLVGYGLATSLVAYALATVVTACGDLLVLGHLPTMVAAISPPRQRGRYLAAFGTSWGVAAVLAPVIGAGLLRSTGVTVTWIVLAALAAGLALMVARLPAP